MKVDLVRADPSGNITLLVKSPVDIDLRDKVAQTLMQNTSFNAQQIGFITQPLYGGEGRVEMAGGEFCGNAVRAFGLYLAQKRGVGGRVNAEITGHTGTLPIETDLNAQTATADMPLPKQLLPITLGLTTGTLVLMEGIAHAVVHAQPDITLLEDLVKTPAGKCDAFGIMFLEKNGHKMTPLVVVPAANTTIWESSCGSGSVAAAVVQSKETHEGWSDFAFQQPGGVLTVCLLKTNGKVLRAVLQGKILIENFDNIVIS